MVEIQIFEEVYTFDTVRKSQLFLLDLIEKYLRVDHLGEINIKIIQRRREPEDPPSTLGINVGEEVAHGESVN